jgi:hypothetical protein
LDFKIKALRVEQTLTYNNREDIYEENHKDILLLEHKDKWNNISKYELSLWTEYGDWYSGWCEASYGYNSLRKVEEFNGFNYVPIRELIISFNFDEKNIPNEIPETENEIITYSYDDGDHYYASGASSVNMDLFTPTPRMEDKRPVWVFKGKSNLGKSYLAHLISNEYEKEVYETDSSERLPDSIIADIVVIGNKYPYAVKDIEEKLYGNNNKVIVVNFESR